MAVTGQDQAMTTAPVGTAVIAIVASPLVGICVRSTRLERG